MNENLNNEKLSKEELLGIKKALLKTESAYVNPEDIQGVDLSGAKFDSPELTGINTTQHFNGDFTDSKGNTVSGYGDATINPEDIQTVEIKNIMDVNPNPNLANQDISGIDFKKASEAVKSPYIDPEDIQGADLSGVKFDSPELTDSKGARK